MSKNTVILISEQNDRIKESFTEYFTSKGAQIFFCGKNGKELLDNIEKTTPDIVLCDVFMAELDAISVKDHTVRLNIPQPYFFIISAFDNEDIIKTVLDAGFRYYFIKPFTADSIYNRIISILNSEKENNHTSIIDSYSTDILHQFKMPQQLNGFMYLQSAIRLAIDYPGYMTNISKRLYPAIAREMGTTPSRVERSIRSVLEATWELTPISVIEHYFPIHAANYTRPSNREFIAHIADTVRSNITYKNRL
ncbi:MAG: response regulator [Oscillospiraceae bacterium]|nr:response regulator [Oscillospiraceae bacterium]